MRDPTVRHCDSKWTWDRGRNTGFGMKKLVLFAFVACLISAAEEIGDSRFYKNLREFGVLPTNAPAQNKEALQRAIDSAAKSGAALFLEPSEEPYAVDGGLVLRRNVSIIGVH